MWGVGCAPFQRALQGFGFDRLQFTFLPGSCSPDPDFGGNQRPNPEELDNMLMLAGICEDIDLLVVNDPDADRVALAEYNQQDEEFYIYHGNEIGIVLCQYMLDKTAGI